MENKFPVCQENLEALRQIVFPLIKWYRENKRILPWRDQNNAYYTWV